MTKPTVTQPDGELVGHTPGPWRVGEQPWGNDTYVYATDTLGSAVCSCNMEYVARSRKEERANARLIARAPALAAEITRLRELVSELMGLLQECADDLEVEIEARYSGGVKDHPAMTPKYERDMEPVNRARTALTRATEAGVQS